MVMERAEIGANVELLQAVEHNLRLAGENNRPIRMNKLQIEEGMLLWRAYDEQTWTVVKKFPTGQVLMKHDYEAEGHRPHCEVWGSRRLVRVPRGLNGGTGNTAR